jgi:pimeloyl-ACP methyl ester carboxylesterase
MRAALAFEGRKGNWRGADALCRVAHMTEEQNNSGTRALLGIAALGVALAGSGYAIARAVAPRLAARKRDRGLSFGTARVHGAVLHFARAGRGPAVFLLHGFPQDWHAWRAVIDRLAKRFTIIVPDLRGIGGSTAGSDKFDTATMASDIRDLAKALKLDRPYVVGHDIGGQVAHAFALQFPQATRGVMILDTPLPGIDGWDECLAYPGLWHVGFLQTPELPETLLAGRHAPFFEHMLGFADFADGQVAESLKAYGSATQLHAACEIYRAFDRNVRFTREHTGANDAPLVLAMGARSPLAALAPRIARGLRDSGFAKVEEATVADAGHFLVNDQPDAVAALIERHAA